MAYYTTGTTLVSTRRTPGGTVLRFVTTRTTMVLQLYLSGKLSAWRAPVEGAVEFDVPTLRATDRLAVLAVDPANASTDYAGTAFDTDDTYGNRIKIRTPILHGYVPGDIWKVYRGDAGDASAGTLVYSRPVFYISKRAMGYGMAFGHSFGYDAYGGPGFGYGFGYQFGFGTDFLEWTSEPLPLGTYPLKVVIEDTHGNTSSEATDTITLTTYPRPARSLAISSYVQSTDVLVLTWTASEDIA